RGYYVTCLVVLLAFHLNVTQQRNVLLVQNIIRKRRAQRAFLRHMARLSMLPLPPPIARKVWMKVRDKDWWERVVLLEYTDVEWTENFRMRRQTFMKLCALMQRYMAPSDVSVRTPVPLTMRVAIVLYKLGSGADYNFISNQFGVHKSTVKKFVYMFCRAMVQGPMEQLIRIPDETQAQEISRGFEEQHHMPQIMGVIDRIHIPILAPSDVLQDFINEKNWASYVLQAVVDNTCRCVTGHISCETPGGSRDEEVLLRSDLFQRAELLPKVGQDVRLQVVGGPSYPLLDWLLKGYANATAEEESFNIYLNSLRDTVEKTFHMLKSRWRVLLKRSDFHFSFSPTAIATCCALHNFCQREGEHVSDSWMSYAKDLDAFFPQPPPVLQQNKWRKCVIVSNINMLTRV
uniref:Protein ANTAGONIST OF LIKE HETEROCHROMATIN PROTEIN 1-like n=1 Tax=Gouania willdenowi TaxID=441366 RepID=A0A8C5NC21_GOUWI